MIHATIWLSVKGKVDKKQKKKQPQKVTYSVIPFIKYTQMAEF